MTDEEKRKHWKLANDQVVFAAESWLMFHGMSNEDQKARELVDSVHHLQNLRAKYGTDLITEWSNPDAE